MTILIRILVPTLFVDFEQKPYLVCVWHQSIDFLSTCEQSSFIHFTCHCMQPLVVRKSYRSYIMLHTTLRTAVTKSRLAVKSEGLWKELYGLATWQMFDTHLYDRSQLLLCKCLAHDWYSIRLVCTYTSQPFSRTTCFARKHIRWEPKRQPN